MTASLSVKPTHLALKTHWDLTVAIATFSPCLNDPQPQSICVSNTDLIARIRAAGVNSGKQKSLSFLYDGVCGHILRRNCLIKHVIEGKLEGTGR